VPAKHLTPKQERFALEYFKTGNASEAYRIAYDAENMAADTIRSKACLLLQQDNIGAMVERLRARSETRAMMTKEQAIARLAEIAMQDKKDRVAAVKELSKIMGWEAPTRQQIEHALASPFEKFMDAATEASQGDEPPAETVDGS